GRARHLADPGGVRLWRAGRGYREQSGRRLGAWGAGRAGPGGHERDAGLPGRRPDRGAALERAGSQARASRQPTIATTAPVSRPRSMPLMNAVLARWVSRPPVTPPARAATASAPPREFSMVAT